MRRGHHGGAGGEGEVTGPWGDSGEQDLPFAASAGPAEDWLRLPCCVSFLQEGRKEVGELRGPEVREAVWAQRAEERLPVPDRPLLRDADHR